MPEKKKIQSTSESGENSKKRGEDVPTTKNWEKSFLFCLQPEILMLSTVFFLKKLSSVSIEVGEKQENTLALRKKKTHKKNAITIKLSSKLPYVSHIEEVPLNVAATKVELLHTNMILHNNLQFS